MIQSFSRVANGATELMLVAGYAGVGKSSLIHEIHKPIISKRGYFISGKFDQFHRNIPYSALIQAYHELVRQLLTETEEQLQVWIQKLSSALGVNGQVIIDVIPEIEMIIGPQPPVPEMGPQETQNRFNLTFQKFIQVFTQKEHPLVVFLDDLQWIDFASLGLVKTLMLDPEIKHLLFVGAYRDNEVDSTHPFITMVEEIKKANATVHSLTLSPLKNESLFRLLSETLQTSPQYVNDLAHLVMKKTNGNPFFINEFLKMLHQEQLLKFDSQQGKWNWNTVQIESQGFTDNVVELMIGKLQKLSKETQLAIQMGAAVGNRFELSVLSIICEKSLYQVAEDLWPAVDTGLLIPIGEGHQLIQKFGDTEDIEALSTKVELVDKFPHDRIQQAAYELIPNAQRKQVHLTIGRLLLSKTEVSYLEEKLFDIVRQLNEGRTLIDNASETIQLMELNSRAAKKAMLSTAYESAMEYFNIFIELMEEKYWEESYDLIFETYLQYIECAYLAHHHSQALQAVDYCTSKAVSILNKADLFRLKSIIYTNMSELGKAEESILQALTILGIPLNDPQIDYTQSLKKESQELFQNMDLQEIKNLTNLSHLGDLQSKKVIDILVYAWLPLVQNQHRDLANLCIIKAIKLSKTGVTHATSLAYVYYGDYLAYTAHDYQVAFEYGNSALLLNDQLNTIHLRPQILFFHALHLNHFGNPIRSSLNLYHEVYNIGIETGNLLYAGFAVSNTILTSLLAGDTVEMLNQTYKKQLALGQRVQYIDGYLFFPFFHQILLALAGKTKSLSDLSDFHFDETQHLDLVNKELAIFIIWLMPMKLLLLILDGKFSEVVQQAEKIKTIVPVIPNAYFTQCYHFYYTLALLVVIEPNDKDHLQIIENNIENLKRCAKACPENFQHQLFLIQAEKAQKQGMYWEAINSYEQAIISARDNAFLHHEALANERLARFLLKHGKEKYAQIHINEALYLYEHWGAMAKVRDLKQEFKDLFSKLTYEYEQDLSITRSIQATSGSKSEELLDLTTVMKVFHTISSEIQFSKLLETLMHLALENSGAQKGMLILETNDQLSIEAEINIDQGETVVFQSIPVDSEDKAPAPRIPVSIIHYVERTLEPLVLDDACKADPFFQDPYVRQIQPKSILCEPILHQGKLTGILYLENNLTSAAFTLKRLELLQLVSSQAAISIENANLYTHLEDKVKERTLDLQKSLDLSDQLNKKLANTMNDLQNMHEQLNRQHNELKNTQAQLIQSEKMASLWTMVAGAAHELNNPNNFIYTGVSNLKYELERLDEFFNKLLEEDDEEVQQIFQNRLTPLFKTLKTINRGSQRIDNIIKGLRTFSGLDEAELKRVNIVQNLRSTLFVVQANYRLKVKFIEDFQVETQLECWAAELNQTFMNIMDNACHAIIDKQKQTGDPTPGNLMISTFFQDSVKDSKELGIRFSDDGCGMSQETQTKIFEPFFTTREVGQGTGLGLAMVFGTLEKHHGRIEVDSQIGKGTTITIYLPT